MLMVALMAQMGHEGGAFEAIPVVGVEVYRGPPIEGPPPSRRGLAVVRRVQRLHTVLLLHHLLLHVLLRELW